MYVGQPLPQAKIQGLVLEWLTPLSVDLFVNNTSRVWNFRASRCSVIRPFVNTHCKTSVLSVTGSDESDLDNLWLVVGFPPRPPAPAIAQVTPLSVKLCPSLRV